MVTGGETLALKERYIGEIESLCCSKLVRGLGFKDMESFNMVMLAKQWWIITHNEKPLSFKVLKSIYFPNIEPMQAVKGVNGSYLWNSLLERMRVVEKRAF